MKQYIMTTPENQKTPENLIQKDQKPDVDRLEKSLISLSKNIGIENDDQKKLEDIVREIVAANIPTQTIQDIMNNLPLDKRFIIEKMMRDEQRRQIMTMSPEKYTQYLQAQFPTGVPTNVGEMALAMVTDTTEMYKNVKQEIGKIGVDGSEHDQSLRKKEQRIAMEATQTSEQETQKLSFQLSQVSQQEMV